MFQKPPHDADHADIFRLLRNTRKQTAYAADNEVYLHARATRLGKLVDHGLVGQAVHLAEDGAFASRLRLFDLLIDERGQPAFQRFGRDQKAVIRKLGVADGYVAEKRRRVLADLFVRGDDVEIGVLFARRFVVIARGRGA